MLMNRLERALMNNPVRAGLQRFVEAPMLLRLGGSLGGGTALELGWGGGVGAALIRGEFGADTVHVFDLDRSMVRRAAGRLGRRRVSASIWVGDAVAIPAPRATYEAVFDFGILHHLPDWRAALREVARVLRPGGRFYGEEVLRKAILHPVTRRLLEHPLDDRFDVADLRRGFEDTGFDSTIVERCWGTFAFFVAHRR
jgi:ubiquinone/menaquinone biosynthesis C-methylase UbiE